MDELETPRVEDTNKADDERREWVPPSVSQVALKDALNGASNALLNDGVVGSS